MPKDKLMYLGNRIRSERKNCDLTQQELADQCGLAIKTVQDIENGRKNPSYETLSLLIERLALPLILFFQTKYHLKMSWHSALLGNSSHTIRKIRKSFFAQWSFYQNSY